MNWPHTRIGGTTVCLMTAWRSSSGKDEELTTKQKNVAENEKEM
jgi:hypothetical protein